MIEANWDGGRFTESPAGLSPAGTVLQARELSPSAGSVVELVESQVALRPGALALAGDGLALTYRDLGAHSAVLAGRLRSLGVGPETVVGLYLDRSPALAVGALGILKAGGAYLPLDPRYPADRVAYMLHDSKADIVVAAQSLARRLPVAPRHVIGLDDAGRPACTGDAPQGLRSTEATASPAWDPRASLAYVIYTSGSTGWPKGAEITHENLANLVAWHRQALTVTADDRASQLAGVGFDAAVWELWPYLTAGASVHIADEVARNDPRALRDWLLSRGITIGFVVTPMIERLLALEWPAKAALRVVLTGGDMLGRRPPPGLPFVLVNNYGPSECTVVTTSGVVTPGEADRPPPIGRPIANAKVHILDEQGNEVPPGSAGELHVGGKVLARGYRNQRLLTAQSFIPDRWSRERGGRLYKTGDLVRSLPDGQLAFLGRTDQQIKIRGYRIEPAEVVAALNQHTGIRESAVIARAGSGSEKRLVAYVVAAPAGPPTGAELRDFLRERLPEFMLPAAFVGLGGLPLTAHGKVDRAALPEPSAENTLPESVAEESASPVEERMLVIVEALLGSQRVALNGNFFELGGHSMLGAQLISRVHETFGVELSLRSVFERPTIRGMSTAIEELILEKLDRMDEHEARRAPGAHEG